MRFAASMVTLAVLLPLPAGAQGLGGWDPEEIQKAEQTAAAFKEADPSLQTFFDQAYAYAVYTSIAKAAFIVGGAHGKGAVFRGGEAIGKTAVTQASVGLQAGGQAYSEIVFFQSESAFNRFTAGDFELAAQASAVVAKEGAAANVAYERGVAVFTMIRGGVMLEASVGGQKFSYAPLEGG